MRNRFLEGSIFRICCRRCVEGNDACRPTGCSLSTGWLRTITWEVKSLAPTAGGVRGDISTFDILDRDVLDVEFDIVSGDSGVSDVVVMQEVSDFDFCLQSWFSALAKTWGSRHSNRPPSFYTPVRLILYL